MSRHKDHTIYYQNSVEPTTLSGADNVNTAQITYSMKVQQNRIGGFTVLILPRSEKLGKGKT